MINQAFRSPLLWEPKLLRPFLLRSLQLVRDIPKLIFRFGEAYQFGLGRPQSLVKALEHFKKAAALGEPRAKARLQEFSPK
jgi:TPR repeat protein